jgi:hypothetical protein
MPSRRLRILTWHVHGNYLYYLTQVPHEFYLVADPQGGPGRAGRAGVLPWGDNVHDAPVDALARMPFDVVLYQSRHAWEVDRHTLLSPAQRALPAIVLEHDPPLEHPTDTRHWCADGDALLVHVTPYNALMWDAAGRQVRIVEHGVRLLSELRATYALPRGIAVVNHILERGRRVGPELWRDARAAAPVDLVGMASLDAGGLGEVPNPELPAFMARYRFTFSPLRYTSLGLALIEAMMLGLPLVGLATTELATVIRNGENGFIDTRPERLHEAMRTLAHDLGLAREMGANARALARERFGIGRFVADWQKVLAEVAG